MLWEPRESIPGSERVNDKKNRINSFFRQFVVIELGSKKKKNFFKETE